MDFLAPRPALEKFTLDHVVGFVLAVAFAAVMGLAWWALLVADYLEGNTVLSEQSHRTVKIVGYAGALAALVAWWMQQFASARGFLLRFLFALVFFSFALLSFGALLRFFYLMVTYPNQLDWSLSGIYWSSLSDFYSFALFMLDWSLSDLTRALMHGLPILLIPAHPAGLLVAAALYLAWFGPREPRQTLDE